MQRNWIGRSEGADVQFEIEGRDEPVTVYTTRPDTLYGATFFVVAADAPLAEEIVAAEQREAFEAYRAEVAQAHRHRAAVHREGKTGVFLGRYAINPVNGERIPVWAADYVLADYGHGAIMAVPAHDQRDLDFAREVRPAGAASSCTPAWPTPARPASPPPARASWSTPARWTA